MAVNLALLILVVYINKYLLQNAAFKTWFIQRLYSFYVTFVKWRGYEHHSILACLLWKVNFFFSPLLAPQKKLARIFSITSSLGVLSKVK